MFGPISLLASELSAGRTTSRKLVETALARIADPKLEGSRAFMKVYSDAALAEADASDRLRALGVVRSPVEGIPISVKDLYDVCGDVTRAGSVALASDPPAKADATAVARLRAAGAVILGRTVTVEFAFGGVGLNPHYGTPKNPYDRASGGRIPGGSSAGAAVSVADGMVAMGLGSDTRGSVRIPAGLCGIAGFKPTQRRIPRDGCFPLSYTLDSVGPLARSIGCCAVYDAILAADGAASSAAAPPALKPSSLRLLVPRASLLFADLQPAVSDAFERALDVLRAAGATLVEPPAAEVETVIARAHALYSGGGFAAPEAWQIHRARFAAQKHLYDPRVAVRIAPGEACSAADYVQLGFDRNLVIKGIEALMQGCDAMVLPTCAITAPTIAEADSSDAAYGALNLLLLRNTGLINIIDGCAATVPCNRLGEAPVGFMVAGLAMSDKHILSVAQGIEAAFAEALAVPL